MAIKKKQETWNEQRKKHTAILRAVEPKYKKFGTYRLDKNGSERVNK